MPLLPRCVLSPLVGRGTDSCQLVFVSLGKIPSTGQSSVLECLGKMCILMCKAASHKLHEAVKKEVLNVDQLTV